MTCDIDPAMSDRGSVADARLMVGPGIPEVAQRLIWDTFFVEAARGIDFSTHLPWHSDPASQTVMLVSDHGAALAAAVVRPASQAGVAMVGYVCVAAAARGKGYGRALIGATNSAIDTAGYRATLLWTGQPEIYVRQGYESISQDNFLSVTWLSPTYEPTCADEVVVTAWPGAEDSSGLPAFATAARRLRKDRSEAIVATGSRGATLIDWKGTVDDVVAILCAAGYAIWNVNVLASDNFLEALPADQFDVTAMPGAVTMVRRADPLFVPSPVAVADRI